METQPIKIKWWQGIILGALLGIGLAATASGLFLMIVLLLGPR